METEHRYQRKNPQCKKLCRVDRAKVKPGPVLSGGQPMKATTATEKGAMVEDANMRQMKADGWTGGLDAELEN